MAVSDPAVSGPTTTSSELLGPLPGMTFPQGFVGKAVTETRGVVARHHHELGAKSSLMEKSSPYIPKPQDLAEVGDRQAPAASRSRSTLRRILPARDLGISLMNSTCRICLKWAT